MELRPAPACGIMMRTLRFADPEALARALCDAIGEALSAPGAASRAIMLAGGSTPMAAYRLLAERRPVVQPGARIFFSDDRLVPPDHPKSNYRHIAPLFHSAGISEEHILRVRGERTLQEAAAEYAAALRRLFAPDMHAPLGLLGLGADGHTASLFSEAHIREAEGRWAIGVQRPDGLEGVSATPLVFRHIGRVIVAVAGEDKRAMAERLVKAPRTIAAGLALQGHRGVELWCDSAAWPFA